MPNPGLNPEWSALDARLSAAKSLLDPHAAESDGELREALSAVNLYQSLKGAISRRYGAQGVTNAWLKMYEMAMDLDLVRKARTLDESPRGGQTHVLRAFCNAELPGAFICALNHLLGTWHPETRFEWIASSLYPEEEPRQPAADRTTSSRTTLGDAYGLYRRNPERWLMTPEMRGDLASLVDVRALVERAKQRLSAVDLYTSDAGIDVSEGGYLRQEELTARIHLGQTLVGLKVLRRGGAMVVKTFTFVRPWSISLLAVCASLFDEFYITKPLTSRPTNSEVYAIGLGFRGLPLRQELRLTAALSSFDIERPLTPLGAPEAAGALASLLAAAREIHLRQVDYLQEAVQFYETYRGRMRTLRHALRPIADSVQRDWLAQHPVARLPAHRQISDDASARTRGGRGGIEEKLARLAATGEPSR